MFSKLQLVPLVQHCFRFLRCQKTKANTSNVKLHAASFAINRSSRLKVFYKKTSLNSFRKIRKKTSVPVSL